VLRDAVAVGTATGAYGLSFGALATAAGLSVWQASALSVLMFTSASQFALIGPLGAGRAKRDASLGDLEIVVRVPVAVGEDVESLLDRERSRLALDLGGMGARGKNFYNDLACRYGFEAEAALVQNLYLSGKRREAEAAVPADLLRATTLVGPHGYVAERLAAFAEAGVKTINVLALDDTREGRRAPAELLIDLAG